jgi:hypothetical protein
MKKLNTNQWFVIATIFAFLAFISFFNIDSALADEKNWNTEFLVGGVISLFLSGICLLKARDVSNN